MTRRLAFLDIDTPMARRVAAHDWSATSLGPIEGWSPVLRSMVALTLGSGFAKCLCWGPDHISIYNDAFAPILGDKGDCIGLPFSVIWQEAWPSIGPIAAKAMAGETTFIKDYPLMIRRSSAGMEEAFFTFSYSPVRDDQGNIIGFMDTVMETTDRVRYERRAAISNRELVHRMKNSYALVSAVVRQSARRAKSVEELTDKLLGRLTDMGQAQDILSLRSHAQASVSEVVNRVRERLDERGDRFSSRGPTVHLTDEQTFALSLALFELATNAVKYGALSNDEGRILVTWDAPKDATGQQLTLRWQETGGPTVEAPRHRGFGSFLVKQLLAAEFNGNVDLDYAPNGLSCTLSSRLAMV